MPGFSMICLFSRSCSCLFCCVTSLLAASLCAKGKIYILFGIKWRVCSDCPDGVASADMAGDASEMPSIIMVDICQIRVITLLIFAL